MVYKTGGFTLSQTQLKRDFPPSSLWEGRYWTADLLIPPTLYHIYVSENQILWVE